MDKIKDYWDDRAAQRGAASAATTDDVFLRVLEADTLTDELARVGLEPGDSVLDVGCGDGATTLTLADRFPDVEFLGLDFSTEMVALADAALHGRPELAGRVRFAIGDAGDLPAAVGDARFTAVITNRCLINLSDPESQYAALSGIAARLLPDGVYMGTENFTGGQANLNAARETVGVPPIPVRWHNLFFDEAEFLRRAGAVFEKVELVSFSSAYYYATRVLYSAMCRREGAEPDYCHPIHEVAVRLPWTGDFSPIKLIRARR